MFDKLRAKLGNKLPPEFADRLRGFMLGLNVRGAVMAEQRQYREVGLRLAAMARKPGEMAGMIKGIAQAQARHDAETGTWISTEQIAAGESGRFDVCNLLNWLEIAKKADVPAIPAKVILRLTDAETEAAGGIANIPTGAIPDRIRARMRQGIENDAEIAAMLAEEPSDPDAPVDMEELHEKLHACMDDVPEGWMVRTTQCGPSTLKALAGTGLVDETAPESRFGPDLEIGPGWIRNGNRRRVDTTDRRLMELYVEGPHTGAIYVARPWQTASRYVEGRDPHRAGTPIDFVGKWPAEWRAFIRDGKCVGVSSYYGWLETPSAFNAAIVLEVRALAQRMADVAIAQGLIPRCTRVETARGNERLGRILDEEGFAEDSFSGTIDFMETPDGIKMIEAGPGATPVGGAHPCAFAGVSGPPVIGNRMVTEGVAFRHMPHVLIGEPSTWIDGDRTGCILTWEEVEALAA